MESTGSSTHSTAPTAAETSLQPLAISDEGNKLAQQSPASSASNNNNKMNEMIPVPEFKCEFCPRTFKSARGRGGHRKVHKELRQVRQNQIEKKRRRLTPIAPKVFNWHYFSSSGVVPFFAGRGAGGRAPAQPSSGANTYLATGRGGQVGRGGHLGSLRKVNQGETAHGIRNLPSLRSSMPMFLSQTGSGTSGLAQPSFAAPARAANGNGGKGGGVHLGSQQDKPEMNQEETTNGIDLTLRL